jgi:flagellar basal-body rod modification protein FlgD
VAIVAGTAGVGQSTDQAEGPRRELTLKTEDFLQLLAAQLRYQNPLEPLDSTQFMGQLAQFAVLQELAGLRGEVQKAQEDLQQLRREVEEQEINRALSLVGLEVKARDASGVMREGVITGVRLINGLPWLLLDEAPVALDAVVEVRRAVPGGGAAPVQPEPGEGGTS